MSVEHFSQVNTQVGVEAKEDMTHLQRSLSWNRQDGSCRAWETQRRSVTASRIPAGSWPPLTALRFSLPASLLFASVLLMGKDPASLISTNPAQCGIPSRHSRWGLLNIWVARQASPPPVDKQGQPQDSSVTADRDHFPPLPAGSKVPSPPWLCILSTPEGTVQPSTTRPHTTKVSLSTAQLP